MSPGLSEPSYSCEAEREQDVVNEDILYTLAGVASALAGFSGVVIVFRQQGVKNWSRTELRYLWFLIGDSFLVVLFSLLPVPLLLAGWSLDAIWALCGALLGAWFILADVLAIRGELQDRKARELVMIPFVTPILYGLSVVAAVIGIALLLSAFDFLVPRGQAIYVLGLIVLLGFGALEFMFFVGRASLRAEEKE
jgi:hypothetical protein